MSQTRVHQLREENRILKEKLLLLQSQHTASTLKNQIQKFTDTSKNNITEMNRRLHEENGKQNEILHALTTNYESVLKKQIELLTENKQYSAQKEAQDKIINEEVQKITSQYEDQIKQFENKVKANVKKIQNLSGGNIINRLLGNQRFRQAMADRGTSLESLEKQSQLEEISVEVEEKEKEIQQQEEKSARLDEELAKMHELIDTMKSLLENMMKEKDNILKQNTVLKEKLKQSEELIGKLLGQGGQSVEEEEGEDGEEQEEEEEEKDE